MFLDLAICCCDGVISSYALCEDFLVSYEDTACNPIPSKYDFVSVGEKLGELFLSKVETLSVGPLGIPRVFNGYFVCFALDDVSKMFPIITTINTSMFIGGDELEVFVSAFRKKIFPLTFEAGQQRLDDFFQKS